MVATMFATPGARAVTTPDDGLTLATFGLLLYHPTLLPGIGFPTASVTAALACVVKPTSILGASSLTAIDATFESSALLSVFLAHADRSNGAQRATESDLAKDTLEHLEDFRAVTVGQFRMRRQGDDFASQALRAGE